MYRKIGKDAKMANRTKSLAKSEMKSKTASKSILKTNTHSPTLKTIRMIEDTLKNMEQSEIKIYQLKKILPRKVNHNTLLEVLEYLDENNKIIFGVRGITWIYNQSTKYRKLVDSSIEISPEDMRKYLKKLDKEYPL
jgi:hypothetical protein